MNKITLDNVANNVVDPIGRRGDNKVWDTFHNLIPKKRKRKRDSIIRIALGGIVVAVIIVAAATSF